MHALDLPFWAVTATNKLHCRRLSSVQVYSTPWHFRQTDKMVQALDACAAGHWKISLVGDGAGLAMLAADLHL